ncbi:MAG TPA: hypothetical protein VEI02_04645, partial [Planctomycetota bacterium]|nr:hypothetical protein [Planctomycetota bacterium]
MPIRGSGLLPSLACLVLCGAPATAQLVGLKLHPGAEKKYQANLVARGADRWLVGDAVSGFRYEPETGKIEIPGNEVTIALADAANP